MARRPAACAAPSRRAHVAGVGAERGRRGCRWDRSHATDAQTLPAVGLRPFRSADAPVLRRWAAAPERFLGVEDLLACADVPGIETSVAIDDGGRIVAVFQVASEGWLRAGMRSIALLVHPGRRGAGFGRASLPAALAEPGYAGSELLAVIDGENTASLRCFAACGFTPDDDVGSGGYVDFVRRAPAGAEVEF